MSYSNLSNDVWISPLQNDLNMILVQIFIYNKNIYVTKMKIKNTISKQLTILEDYFFTRVNILLYIYVIL